MRFVRFKLKSDPKGIEIKGIYDQETADITTIHGSIFMGCSITAEKYAIGEVDLLPPILPSNIICHAYNGGYIKTVSSLSGSGAQICAHEDLKCIPRVAYIIDPRAKKNVFGYTMMLDFIYKGVGSADASKDNHTIIGPCIFTMEQKLVDEIIILDNGKRIQSLSPSPIDFSGFTLRPGDISAYPMSEASAKDNDKVENIGKKDTIVLDCDIDKEIVINYRGMELRALVNGKYAEC